MKIEQSETSDQTVVKKRKEMNPAAVNRQITTSTSSDEKIIQKLCTNELSKPHREPVKILNVSSALQWLRVSKESDAS